MSLSVRSRLLVLMACLAGLLTAAAAQSTDDLPSAPSSSASPAATQPKAAPPKASPAAPPIAAAPNENAPQTQAEEPSESTNSRHAGDNAEAGAKPEKDDESGIRIPVAVNEVNVVFTVTDKHNHYVKDLGKSDFKVIDDKRAVDDIRSFRRETDLPLQVGILIDSSASVRGRFKFEQESAIEFLNQTLRAKYDEAFVLGFDSSLEITQDFTDSTEMLSKGIRALRPGNGTRMYDALFYACRDKIMKTPQTGSVRRAIILVSDGDDNESHSTREEAIEMALRANVIVYTISTNYASSGESERFDKILERIADATGGRTFRPFQPSDVANAFTQIEDDLRSQYALGYRPPDFAHDGRYRTIDITAVHKGLKVQSRHGYYAPAE
jgi:Ca-activated chloride channel family protein